MTKYREILRLRSLGLSQNDIASSCHVSKKTVNRVLKLAQEHNLRWPLEESLTDREIDKIIHPDGNTAKKPIFKNYCCSPVFAKVPGCFGYPNDTLAFVCFIIAGGFLFQIHTE